MSIEATIPQIITKNDTLYTMRPDASEYHVSVVAAKGRGKPCSSNAQWISTVIAETKTYDEWIDSYVQHRASRPGFKGNLKGALHGAYITVNCIIGDGILVKSEEFFGSNFNQVQSDYYHYGNAKPVKTIKEDTLLQQWQELETFMAKPVTEADYRRWIDSVVLAIETIAGNRVDRETRYYFACQAFQRRLQGRRPIRGSQKMIILGF